MDIQKLLDSDFYYTPEQFDDFIRDVGDDFKLIKNNKKIAYYNIPCSFDIETTSFYYRCNKCSVMYEWTLGINFVVMIGRTWEEFLKVYNQLVKWFITNNERRLLIYSHNLGFEFQAMRKHLEWEKIFALKERKPVQCITIDGIEFRCSLSLSGYSLRNLGENLKKYKVKKMVGDLDYKLIRHHETPLTKKEIGYCLNDVKVVMAYIQETIERLGNITKIPLTKTGYVRRYCKESCLYGDKSHRKDLTKYNNYRAIMNMLTLEPLEYQMLKRAFSGGFTHANPFHSRGIFYNVWSFDFTSSYPAVMLSEMFPMSKGEFVKIKSEEDFRNNLNNYCCLFDISFTNLRPKITYENYLSVSHCRSIKNGVENNGRLVSADYLISTITELDFSIIRTFYDWDYIEIGTFIRYRKGYLPTDFVKSILQLYVDKTTLKGVAGQEVNYMLSKEKVNSAFGMCVTDICREEINYESDEWLKTGVDINESIEKYNKSKNRFLSYAWGIWITAYARFNLFTGICEFENDYIYSDTDSLKVQNYEKHLQYFEDYNEELNRKLRKAMKYHNIDFELTRPKTIKGEEKPIGVWDNEGMYTRFKTLGAKRYITEKDGKISLTVSGVNKRTAVPYLLAKYGDNIFRYFDDELSIPSKNDLGYDIFTDDKEHELIENPCGKMTHTYIDIETMGYITDYLGSQVRFRELSGTHLENAGYDLSISQKYIDYLLGVYEDYD